MSSGGNFLKDPIRIKLISSQYLSILLDHESLIGGKDILISIVGQVFGIKLFAIPAISFYISFNINGFGTTVNPALISLQVEFIAIFHKIAFHLLHINKILVLAHRCMACLETPYNLAILVSFTSEL